MKTLKIIGLLALVFAAGFAGGVMATRMIVRHMVAEAVAHPAGGGVKMEQALNRKLRLNKEQREQIHEILKTSHDRVRSVREEYQPQFNAAVLDARTNIFALLKPDQREQFTQFLVDNRQFLPTRELPPLKKNKPANAAVEADVK